MKIGQRLKKIRELHNLSQQHLADKLNITQQNYSKMETGEIDFPVSRLQKFAEALDIKPEEIFILDEKTMFSNNYCYFRDNSVGIGQQSTPNIECKQHEAHIIDLQKEIIFLRDMLAKSLIK